MRKRCIFRGYDIQSNLKYYFWQLLFQPKHYIIKSKISVRFVKSLNFFESGKFWGLLGGERYILKRWSRRSILFEIPFLTTFILTKTFYNQIWNVREICQILQFLESGKFCRLLGGEWCNFKGWSWGSILFKITYLTTFISIIKLYNQILIFGIWSYPPLVLPLPLEKLVVTPQTQDAAFWSHTWMAYKIKCLNLLGARCVITFRRPPDYKLYFNNITILLLYNTKFC